MEELNKRLRDIIKDVCNKIGCKNCDLDYGDGCAASDLQNRISENDYDQTT